MWHTYKIHNVEEETYVKLKIFPKNARSNMQTPIHPFFFGAENMWLPKEKSIATFPTLDVWMREAVGGMGKQQEVMAHVYMRKLSTKPFVLLSQV